jgi:hypothetical protein
MGLLIFQILDLDQAAEEDCYFMADSGIRYRRLH